ncbi:MAG: hypothetical protein U0M13_00060 [Desulfovibrio fairfieldensis]|nr:hypothetical protein [Desulfovibrio fairfieldensis]
MEDTAEDTEEFSALEEAWELGEELLSELLQPVMAAARTRARNREVIFFFIMFRSSSFLYKAENRISARCNFCFAAHPANCPGRRILS